jgi:hypothetical protein
MAGIVGFLSFRALLTSFIKIDNKLSRFALVQAYWRNRRRQ